MKIEKIENEEQAALLTVACKAARREVEAGRSVVVLMEELLACKAYSWGDPPEGLFIRSDKYRSSLMSLSVATIILVRPSALKNARFAIRHMLASYLEPKIIEVGE